MESTATKSFIYSMFTALAFAATSAQAIPMLETDSSNAITGVSGLLVGGVVYDATFNDGSFNDLLSRAPPDPLYSSQFASDANSALASFIANVVTNPYDPSRFVGCFALGCYLTTAVDITPPPSPQFVLAYSTDVQHGVGFPLSSFLAIVLPPDDGLPVVTDDDDLYHTYVTWQPSTVPEPPVALLMASGLIAFWVTRRKRRA
jgi:hypothetical protein